MSAPKENMSQAASRPSRIALAVLRRVAAFLIIGGWAATSSAVGLEPTLISIGTGSKTGVYYLAGGAICGLVDDRRWETGIRCVVRSSNGSIENLRAIRSGKDSFGIVQSDWQYHAVQGTSVFQEVGPDRELRAVFSLFHEPFTVVARPDAGISTFADLKGKRVDIGPPGSGGRATMEAVMESLGWTGADFAYVSDLALSALPRALCAGDVDAAVFIVAHPNLTIEDMITTCDAAFVPFEGPDITRLIEADPYYSSVEIPARTYLDQSASVATFALTATLVTSSRTSPAVVYELTKAVFENLTAFRENHPAFANLQATKMTTAGLTAKLHEGALRYFEEVGLR